MREITASEIRTYLRCREEHRIAYGLQLRSREIAPALAFGSAMHLALEAWWGNRDLAFARAVLAEAPGLSDYEAIRADEMLQYYDAQWGEDCLDWQVLGLELPLRRALGEGWRLAGKLDGLLEDARGRRVVIEHKTTTEDIGPGAPYWDRLVLDPQVHAYLLLTGVSSILWDVLRKPTIEPRRATAIDRRRKRKDGAWVASVRLEDERLEEYRERVSDALDDADEVWFARREISLLESERERAINDIVRVAQEIVALDPTQPQPRSPDACKRYGRVCQYTSYCVGHAALEDMPLVRLAQRHPELEEK